MGPVLNWNWFYCCIRLKCWRVALAAALEHDANAITRLLLCLLPGFFSSHQSGGLVMAPGGHLDRLRSQPSSDVPGGPPERSRSHHRRAGAATRHHSQVMLKGRLRRDVIVLTTSQTLEKWFFMLQRQNYSLCQWRFGKSWCYWNFGSSIRSSLNILNFGFLPTKSTKICIKKEKREMSKFQFSNYCSFCI